MNQYLKSKPKINIRYSDNDVQQDNYDVTTTWKPWSLGSVLK